ncbi:MAG: hypothetical protein ACE5EG_11750 [Thermoanaerobaculia bacterium]
MKTTRVVLLLIAALALVTALPAAAEYYTIKLKNGNEFDTLYRPRLATEGGDKVLVATETGNWISLRIDAIESVVSHIEARGFGKVINTTTILIGTAPNDAEVPGEEDEPVDPATRLLNYLESQQRPQQAAPFTVEQFAEPNSVGGIPLGFTNTTTPPLTGSGVGVIEPPVAGNSN